MVGRGSNSISEAEARARKKEYFRLYARRYKSIPENRAKVNACRREWRAKNRESLRAKENNHRKANAAKILERERAWKAKNRDKILKQRADWRDQNREKLNASARAYVAKNRDCVLERRRARKAADPEAAKAATLAYKEPRREKLRAESLAYYYAKRAEMETDRNKRIRQIAMSAKCRSAKRGIACDVGFADEFIANPPTHCVCCSNELDYTTSGRNPFGGPSLDRVDNDEGYVKGNVAVICRRCNTAKSDRSIKDFIQIIRYIQSFNASKDPQFIDYYGLQIPVREMCQ